MAQEYETLLHRWFEEVWNNKSEEAIDEMFAEDGIANGLNDADGNPLRGPEAFKTLQRAFIAAYPDLNITVEDTITEGNKIAARCTVRATHAGEGLGMTPTNQPIEFTGLTIVQIRDGKIIEAWNEFDFMKMYQQIGVLTLNQNRENATDNDLLVRRWFEEVWNQKNESAIDEMLDENAVHRGLGGIEDLEIRGTEQFKQFYRGFISAFPDIHVNVEDSFSVGEKLTARCTVTGTHKGEGLGIPPTNREVKFTGNGHCVVKNGKFVEVYNEFDFLKMYHQLGIVTFNQQ